MTSEADQDMISLNGISLNGISLNGISLNGTSMSGLSVVAVGINGTTSAGVPLVAKTSTAPLAGTPYNGSFWTGTVSNGASIKLRVDAATAGTAPNADAWFYTISYQTQSGWSPLCGLDASSKPIQAVAVAGVWGPSGADAAKYSASAVYFTLACRTKTIAKCIELGYKPYKGYTTQLQACVRLLRGDFCGTGYPYTVDGTTLNLYDNVGVQTDTQSWLPEAEWSADGAVCVNSKNNARYDLVTSTDPGCVASIKTTTCGTKFSTGTVLIDELAAGTVQ